MAALSSRDQLSSGHARRVLEKDEERTAFLREEIEREIKQREW